MYAQRLLKTDNLNLNNISQSLSVDVPIDFVYAGIETVDMPNEYTSTPKHPGNGFYGRM